MKILCVKNRAMGDSLITLSALAKLKRIIPSLQLDYLIPSWIKPLYNHLAGPYDNIYPLKKGVEGFLAVSQLLLNNHYDFVLEFNQSGSTGKWFSLLQQLGVTQYRYHNHHKKKGNYVTAQGQVMSAIQRDMSLVESFLQKELSIRAIEESLPFEVLSLKSAPLKKKRILLGLAASRLTKVYPLPLAKELAEKMHHEWPEMMISVPLSLSVQDRKIASVVKSWNYPWCQVENVPLEDLPLLVAESLFYVGSDTGIKHLSVSLGVKTFTFFGPEDPFEWHPYDKKDHPYFFVEELACRTQKAHYCALDVCESMICLSSFSPEEVIKKLKEV